MGLPVAGMTTNQGRVGFALQSYMRPDVMQLMGDIYWLDIQGNNERGQKAFNCYGLLQM